MLDCPYSGLGGVIVKGDIVRTATLNVRGIRKMTPQTQEYILGLGLYALTYPVDLDLRADTNLVITKSEVSVLNEDGTRETISLTFADAKAFAQQAAAKFGVGETLKFVYDEGKALAKLGKQAEASIKKAEKKDGKAKAAKTAE